ncbi:endonuclease/exonuclease/phosphatase family protein [Sphingobacterium bovistauri]|uniref:Endonuclease/exonuclease/phosphatase family protein n=1 Tax=Sphingobacterium bovistauri TaxID=2781959 RepID=A0ABS7ZAH3_9SPHI|nr:endonuclease/exonuclease/phosphatase family protein [Sphingobacterium bovistauri]MCA5005860.1 endonuclease/exonuclease/phosphatase family protein [Sphingobacterium bovistauri]
MKFSILTLIIILFFSSCISNKNPTTLALTKRKLITLTYNIHHGAPANSKEVSLENIAKVIKKSGADIVALQEVDVNVARSGNLNQAAELAKLLSMYYYFSKSIDFGGGEYGVAILSKYKLTNTRNELLLMPVAGEQRSVALATIQLPGNVFVEFGSTHLDLNVPNRTAQVEQLNSISRRLNRSLMIGGDYNAEPYSDEMVKLKKEFNLACNNSYPLTFPVINPTKSIDFMTFNKIASSIFTVASVKAMNGEYASDHLPLVVEFIY